MVPFTQVVRPRRRSSAANCDHGLGGENLITYDADALFVMIGADARHFLAAQ